MIFLVIYFIFVILCLIRVCKLRREENKTRKREEKGRRTKKERSLILVLFSFSLFLSAHHPILSTRDVVDGIKTPQIVQSWGIIMLNINIVHSIWMILLLASFRRRFRCGPPQCENLVSSLLFLKLLIHPAYNWFHSVKMKWSGPFKFNYCVNFFAIFSCFFFYFLKSN